MNPSIAGTLAARARAVIPGGVNSGQRQIPGLEDLVVLRTEGCTFEDSEGRIHTDYQPAFGPALRTNPGHPVLFAGTVNGHPACAAAALATIAKLEHEPVYEHIFGLGERIRRELAALYERLGAGRARGPCSTRRRCAPMMTTWIRPHRSRSKQARRWRSG